MNVIVKLNVFIFNFLLTACMFSVFVLHFIYGYHQKITHTFAEMTPLDIILQLDKYVTMSL